MGRKSQHNLPPGIHKDQHGVLWATLEGQEARHWRERYPARTMPRRRARDLKHAIQLQRLLIRDLETGRDPQAENPTIGELVERWIDGRNKIASSTRKRYRLSLTWQIKPFRIARLRVRQITADHIREWVRMLTIHPRQNDPDRALDAYSIRNAFAVLRAELNAALLDGLIPKNPCKGIELPDPDDEEIHPMSLDQVDTFLGLVNSYHKGHPHRLAALYHVAIRCGLRQGELIGLRWADVELERGEIRITGQIQRGQRKKGKTRKAHRTVPLAPDLVEFLREHWRTQHAERSIAGEGWNAADLVFC